MVSQCEWPFCICWQEKEIQLNLPSQFCPMRIALFPGTFDPVTFGHIDIIERALSLFDKLVIGIGVNSNKAPMFSAEQRMCWLHEIFKNESRVEAVVYERLTVECCKQVGATYILRGI